MVTARLNGSLFFVVFVLPSGVIRIRVVFIGKVRGLSLTSEYG